MKKFTIIYLFLFALVFNFSSCGKKEDDPKPLTKKEILSAKTWKMNKMMGDGIDVTNDPDLSDLKNLRLKFASDGTYTMTSSGDSDNGIWEFGNSETVITLDPDTNYEENWVVTELKDNSLKIRTTMIFDDGSTMLFEFEMIYAQ